MAREEKKCKTLTKIYTARDSTKKLSNVSKKLMRLLQRKKNRVTRTVRRYTGSGLRKDCRVWEQPGFQEEDTGQCTHINIIIKKHKNYNADKY